MEGGDIVALMGILSGTGMLCFIVHSIREVIIHRSPGKDVSAELKALRSEISQLRARNNDVLLGLEAVQQRLDQPRSISESALSRQVTNPEEQVHLGSTRS